jgi:dienelactone hydrolase
MDLAMMISHLRFISRLTRLLFVSLAIVLPLSPGRALEGPQPEIVSIPARAAGTDWKVHTQVFKPEGPGPFPLVVFSHGRAGKPEERQSLEYPVLRGHVTYWMRKGFAVVAPIRPGYGVTGGADLEASTIGINKQGVCTGSPLFEQAVGNAADVVSEVVAWARRQAWVNNTKIVLVGQSVGGMTTVAAGARALPGVIAYINFAGGHGGNPDYNPGKSCFPETLTSLYGKYGRTTRIPNLWLYASNDQYWGPDMPQLWHDAFARAGGQGRLIKTGPVPGEDGHKLLSKGGRLWGDHVNPFMDSLGFKTLVSRR